MAVLTRRLIRATCWRQQPTSRRRTCGAPILHSSASGLACALPAPPISTVAVTSVQHDHTTLAGHLPHWRYRIHYAYRPFHCTPPHAYCAAPCRGVARHQTLRINSPSVRGVLCAHLACPRCHWHTRSPTAAAATRLPGQYRSTVKERHRTRLACGWFLPGLHDILSA